MHVVASRRPGGPTGLIRRMFAWLIPHRHPETYQLLTGAEAADFLDQRTQAMLGMPLAEFRRQLRSGEAGDSSSVAYLSVLAGDAASR